MVPWDRADVEMKIFSEFREFISRGSVIDLAVGVIIGAAYSKLVTSAVDQVIMPPIGLMMGGVDFSQFKLVLKPAAGKTPEVAVQYGVFINTLIQFVIIAATVFLLVKLVNTVKRLAVVQEHQAAAAAAPSPTEILLREIRDLLKAGQAAPDETPPAAPRRTAHQKGSAVSKRS